MAECSLLEINQQFYKLLRFVENETLAVIEPATYDVLVVGGGGAGGGSNVGAGGGAGAVRLETNVFFPTGSYPVVIGAGGVGTTTIGVNGETSSINNIEALGGGGGGGGGWTSPMLGYDGGCGGGVNGANTGTGTPGLAVVHSDGNVYGFNGGHGYGTTSTTGRSGGGGGGAGAVGQGATSYNGGDGGAGLNCNSFFGYDFYFGGGGGGATNNSSGRGYGGLGGGGEGTDGGGEATSGVNGLGGGGGGRCSYAVNAAGSGGSGVVYLKKQLNAYTGSLLEDGVPVARNLTIIDIDLYQILMQTQSAADGSFTVYGDSRSLLVAQTLPGNSGYNDIVLRLPHVS